VFKKILLAAVAPLAVLGSVALAGAANAAPLPVTTSNFVHDQITGITATSGTGTLILSPAGGIGAVTCAIPVGTTDDGFALSVSPSNVLGTSSFTATAAAPATSVTVTCKDAGGAVATAVVGIAAVSTGNTELTFQPQSTATERLFIANHPNGDPTLVPAPATVDTMISDGGAGLLLTGDVLSSGSAGVGTYNGVTVTAMNPATGAVAVESFTAKVGPVVIIPVHPVVPYVYAGHVITVDSNSATVGWSDSALGWPSANHCVEVREFGYGFTVNGSPHVGFTCDNGNPAQDVGYLSGLAPHHTYFLQVVPAVGTYGDNHQIPGTDAHGGIDVVTTS